MIEKRRPFLTHIILWILIPVILFPIIWIVSTSIRRDEAIFSTKLFSSRVSLQNYRDLIAPEKNIPALVQEMQSLILRTSPYDSWEEKRLKEVLLEDIEAFKGYLQETRDRYERAQSSFDNINLALSSRSNNIKEEVLVSLRELKEYLEKNVPVEESNEENLKIVLYQLLYPESYNSKLFIYLKEDLEKVSDYHINSPEDYEKALSALEKTYQISLGSLTELAQLEKKLEENSRNYGIARTEYEKIEEEILSISQILNSEVKSEITSLLEELKAVEIIKNTENKLVSLSKDTSPGAFTPPSLEVLNLLIENLSKYPDFYELSNSLREISSYLASYEETAEGNLASPYLVLENLYIETSPLLSRLEKNVNDIQEAEKNLIALKEENTLLKNQQELLREGIKKVEETLIPATRAEQVQIFIKKIEEQIAGIEEVTKFEELVSYCVSITKDLLNFVTSYIMDFGEDNLSSQIEATTNKLSWFNDYSTFSDRFNKFSKNLDTPLEKSNSLISDFEKKWADLLRASLNGEKVSVRELDELYNIIKTDYVNMVGSNISVVSRKAGDLMDTIPYRELKKDLNSVDKELFRINQIWTQKTKHYFLRWVKNSIVVAGVAALITTFVCSLAAYPFSRMRFWGRKYGILAMLLIQMFPSAVYMIAVYSLLNLLGKFIPLLGLDTLTGLTFIYLGNIAYNVYLIKGYYDTIPSSLEESAMIDGATRFQTFYKIVIPLALPILTVVVILTFMNIFNEFVFARIILQDAKNYTYAIGLWTFSSGPYQTEWGLFTAAALLGMLPMTVLFLSLQKYIVSGLTKGAVKG
ncbi:ABC transporter permease subunit [Candidatus Sordicultor fermentans]|uniref:ABC transporter permease subunit n=1 Tax=Candidatus Sordicultor fermentans TaxID=1953203 RepID=UPI0016927533|nr:ABC transporter permease subunit [Candidatus Atribacteria bacterium]